MLSIKDLFFLFIFYSFLGWVIEVVRSVFKFKKIINRGFLIGPYCPIWGLGAVLMTIFLKVDNNPFFTIFLKSILIGTSIEYFSSYLLEKIFKYRWWDYSERKCNVNGRICLETTMYFGIGSCFIIYFLNPVLLKLILSMNDTFSTVLFIILLMIITIDIIISVNLIVKLRGIKKNTKADSTEELNQKIMAQIKKHTSLYKRIFKTFPNWSIIKRKDE